MLCACQLERFNSFPKKFKRGSTPTITFNLLHYLDLSCQRIFTCCCHVERSKKVRLLKGADAYGQGGLVLSFKLIFQICEFLKMLSLKQIKGHLHCYIETSIMMYNRPRTHMATQAKLTSPSWAQPIWRNLSPRSYKKLDFQNGWKSSRKHSLSR